MEKGYIYKILNTISDKPYIGSTIQEVTDRWKTHKSLLNNGKHWNDHLQNSWNKYGSGAFTFYVFTKCHKDQIAFVENYWIHELNTVEQGYNQTYHTFREENHEGSMKGPRPSIAGDNNPCYGLKGDDHPFGGKTHNKEVRRAIKESQQGENSGCNKLTNKEVKEIKNLLVNSNLTFKNIAENFNVDQSTIGYINRGETWSNVEIENDQTYPLRKDRIISEKIKENARELGKSQKGTSNTKAKLNKHIVKCIRIAYRSSDSTYEDIAEEYNITKANVGNIIRGDTWSHVEI